MATKIVRFSIAAKAALFTIFLFVLCAGVIVFLNTAAVREMTLDETWERTQTLARSSAALARDDIRAREPVTLSRFLEEVANQPGVSSVYALGTDGRVLADGDPQTPASPATFADRLAVQAWVDGEELSYLDNGAVEIAVPVTEGEELVGVVRLTMSLGALESRTTSTLRRNLLLSLLGLGLALPLTGIAISRMMRPVRRLTEASERVNARQLDVRIDVRTGDELEVLATAFNEMMDQLKSSMSRVRHLAYIDDLSKLPNKTAFFEHFRRALKTSDTPGALLIIDLDRFKRLNDTYGAREGDRIISIAADRLRDAARSLKTRYTHPEARPPVLARLSGDEFVMLIRGPAPTGVSKQVAREIVDALGEPMTIAGQHVSLTASIGIARFPLDAADGEHLLRHANLALDAAKADGGAGFRFFEPEMSQRAVERVTMENELRQAIARNEFEVHYQPQIDARSGEITGCEALARWRRRGALVGPGAFIQMAEESGMIVDIGRMILVEACTAAARWRDQGVACPVAVNVSAVQFQSDGFARDVLTILNDTGLEPSLLELELTESVAMDDPDLLTSQVEPLRARGVRFAIDDFGTGHSSLGSLTRLPIDVFKIDQSFVRRMEQDHNDRVVIETILAMARALGYETVAEGVETASQFAFLRLNGVTTAQGWYFAKAEPEAVLVGRLRDDRRKASDAPAAAAG